MAENFIDQLIDGRVSTQFRRVVTGKTDIVTMNNGRERRNAAWAFKKMRFTANYAMLTPDAQEKIVSTFYACNAQLLLFRFRDQGDFRVENNPMDTQELIGTYDPIQLKKTYTFGPVNVDRVLQAVRTCVVKNSAGEIFEGSANGQFGLFSPQFAWEDDDYTWSGTFDLWVRFNSDDLDVTMETSDIATTDIELIEQIAYAT